MRLVRTIISLTPVIANAVCLAVSPTSQGAASLDSGDAFLIRPHVPRLGRAKPVVAVIGANTFTELTDHVIPYGIPQGSGVADVFALATQAGQIQMFPAIRIRPQATSFDAGLCQSDTVREISRSLGRCPRNRQQPNRLKCYQAGQCGGREPNSGSPDQG